MSEWKQVDGKWLKVPLGHTSAESQILEQSEAPVGQVHGKNSTLAESFQQKLALFQSASQVKEQDGQDKNYSSIKGSEGLRVSQSNYSNEGSQSSIQTTNHPPPPTVSHVANPKVHQSSKPAHNRPLPPTSVEDIAREKTGLARRHTKSQSSFSTKSNVGEEVYIARSQPPNRNAPAPPKQRPISLTASEQGKGQPSANAPDRKPPTRPTSLPIPTASKQKHTNSHLVPPPPPPPPKPSINTSVQREIRYKAKWTFSPRHFDELELNAGDIVREAVGYTKKIDSGWIYAEILANGKKGLLPVNYLEEFASESSVSQNFSGQTRIAVATNVQVQNTPNRNLEAASRTTYRFNSNSSGESIGGGNDMAPIMGTRSSDGYRNVPSGYPSESTPIRKQAGYATDVIGVLSSVDAKLFATSFNIRFSGRGAKSSSLGKPVDVLIDGTMAFFMTLREGGVCTFPNGSFQCDPAVLGALKRLQTPGPHSLRYEYRYTYNGEYYLAYVDAFIWVWRHTDSLLVSDIDGTITKSDIGGMINGVLGAKMGWKKGHAHQGVCSLYNDLVNQTGAKVLYLTARPLNLINETRSYVYELEQDVGGKLTRLPSGAIITDTTNYTSSFRREVVDKTSHVFKIQMLQQLRECFRLAGRDIRRYPVFLAAFGNKDTDVKAYLAAGAPEITVFVIDTSSCIQVASEFRVRMRSYHDPELHTLLIERMEWIKTGKVPDPNLPIELG